MKRLVACLVFAACGSTSEPDYANARAHGLVSVYRQLGAGTPPVGPEFAAIWVSIQEGARPGASSLGCRRTADLIDGWAGAGAVTVDVGANEFVLQAVDGRYMPVEIDPEIVAPGATVGVSSAGGDIDAFAGAGEVPPLIGEGLPDNGVVIATSAPFTVTWTPATQDAIVGFTVTDFVDSVLCTAADGDGEVTVGPELLSLLGEGERTLVLSRFRRTRLEGEEDVDMILEVGTLHTASATLEP